MRTSSLRFAGGLNTYAYVGENPVSLIDPTGLLCIDKSKLLLGGAGALLGTAAFLGGAEIALVGGVGGKNPGAAAYGLGIATMGFTTFQDGVNMMRTSVDGVDRRSFFGNVGYVFGGQSGAQIGEAINTGLSMLTGPKAAAAFVNSGGRSVLDGIEATATAGQTMDGSSNCSCQ